MLDGHPMDFVQWAAPTSHNEIDRRVVVNPKQARTLLAAVSRIAPELEAFFGSMYYAALRPEEALHLAADEYEPPKHKGGWGWLHLTGATVAVGNDWSDGEGAIEHRALKHRGTSATRDVPAAPALCTLIERHIKAFPPGANGRLFRATGYGYRPVSSSTYTRVWRQDRAAALTAAQQRSPLAKVPYHLRHAAVSLQLNAGVPATQVAEWAGHSVHVLLKVYAKCIDGQEEAARRRIEAALDVVDDQEAAPG